ncbi:MAG TPA: hypothetical protein VGN14_09095 [Candidatus Elarobacter sp.]
MIARTRRTTKGDAPAASRGRPAPGAQRCRRKFLRYFPEGFRDDWYVETERAYKWQAHLAWREELDREKFSALLRAGEFHRIANHVVRLEARTNLLFSFEKMALRDAVKSDAGAEAFSRAVYRFLHGNADPQSRFEEWVEAVEALPRRQTRVLTWPIATVVGFIAEPRTHIFLKPMVTKTAAHRYGFPFHYRSRPSWEVYENYRAFAAQVRADNADLRPRDMIDLQSFIWVQGSDEYD